MTIKPIDNRTRVLFISCSVALILLLGSSAVSDFYESIQDAKDPTASICFTVRIKELRDELNISRYNFGSMHDYYLVLASEAGQAPLIIEAHISPSTVEAYHITGSETEPVTACYLKKSPDYATKLTMRGQDIPILGSIAGRAGIQIFVLCMILFAGFLILHKTPKENGMS